MWDYGKAALFHLFCSLFSYVIRIVKKSESCGGVKISDCTVQHLLFADDLVLLLKMVFTQNGLQQALDRFSDACSLAGMKISIDTTKTEPICPCACPDNHSSALSKLMEYGTTKTVGKIQVPRRFIHE